MKSGRLPEEAAPDDVIAGSQRDPSRLDDDLPEEDLALSSSGRAGAE
jgi:hypothetical protein